MASKRQVPNRVGWGNVPRAAGTFYEFLSVPMGTTVQAISTSKGLLECGHHYGAKGFACPLDGGPCYGCDVLKQHPRPEYYLCGVDGSGETPVIIKITDFAFRHCPALWDRSIDLRGYTIGLTRKPSGVNGKVLVAIKPPLSRRLVPAPFDLKRALKRIWGQVDATDVEIKPDTSPIVINPPAQHQEGGIVVGPEPSKPADPDELTALANKLLKKRLERQN